jgi:hypothetical protein
MSTTLRPVQPTAPREALSNPEHELELDLRREAIASLKRKRKCVEDVVAYVTVNGVLWVIWALTDRSSGDGLPWPAYVSVIWGFVLAVDVWKAFGRWPRNLHGPITEADVERELRRFGG